MDPLLISLNLFATTPHGRCLMSFNLHQPLLYFPFSTPSPLFYIIPYLLHLVLPLETLASLFSPLLGNTLLGIR